MLKQNRYFLLENNYVIDLINVDFITKKTKKAANIGSSFTLVQRNVVIRLMDKMKLRNSAVWSTVHGQIKR